MNWLILCIVFYCAGFGLMFGTHSAAGWFGTNLLVPAPGGQLVPKDNADHGQTGAKDQSSEPSQQTIRGHATPEMHAALEEEKRVPGEVEAAYAPLNGLGLEFLLFQLAFAATTATIVDGAIAERTAMLPYIAVTVLVGIFIYPVFGHWAWNDASPSLSLRTVWNSGWLKLAWLSEAWKEKLIYKDVYGPHLGFHDFAGSTVVHSVGAWIAWVGCRFIGPRRFFTPTSNPSQPYSLGYAVLGVIMLWFGWWGFNGGSLLQYDTTIASIILNTNLAGASAGLISYADALRRKRRNPNLNLYVFTIGGTLGGLVAITASCDVATPAWSMFIGVVAGFVHNWALNGLPKWSGLDDVAGAIPVHGFCGVWGTLCTGVVIWLVHDGSRWQLLVQFVGALVAFIWAWGASWLVFSLVSKTLGLRVSIEEEEAGAREPMVGILNPDLLISQRPRTRLRSWTFDGPAWSRFEPLKEIAPSLVKEYGSRTKATEAVTSALRQRGRYQVIRSDGTESTPEDVEGTLGNADWL